MENNMKRKAAASSLDTIAYNVITGPPPKY